MTASIYRLFALVLVWALSANADDEAALAQLLSDDGDEIERAVAALAESSDPAYYDLLQALFSGEVYRWTERAELGGLVAIGDEEMDEYGDSIVPLFTVFPERRSIVDESGEQVVVALYDLQEVETGRKIRALIQPYLIQKDLFNGDAGKRRVAAERIGNWGKVEDISILKRAIEQERDSSILRLKQVSLAKLMLGDDDVSVRLGAIEKLGDSRSPLAIPPLKALLLEAENAPVANVDIRDATRESLRRLEQFNFFMQVLQTLFIGLSLGAILVLVSLGLAIVYGQMGVINMAHGEFMMIGAYTTFTVQNICMDLLPAAYVDLFFVFSLPFAFVVSGAMGLLIEALIIRHLYSRPLESLLATWGVSLLLIQGARSIFGDLTAVKLPQLLSGGFEIAPQVVLPYNRVFIMVLATAIVLALLALFFRTNFGLRLRATTQNSDMSACVGIPVRRVDAMAFALGTGVAGVAGWAMTLIGNVVPNMGQTYIVDAFLVVVTGGVGKLLGTISAGLGIGIFNKILEPVFEAVYGKVILLGLIILFLQSRPTGLFPARGRHEDL